MKGAIFAILFLIVSAVNSQTKFAIAKVNVEVIADYIEIFSDSDILDPCKLVIMDAGKNIIVTTEFPKGIHRHMSKLSIHNLEPGNYICLVYKGKEEVGRKEFFKDAFFSEPQPLIKPKN